jgi:hypothetical protein
MKAREGVKATKTERKRRREEKKTLYGRCSVFYQALQLPKNLSSRRKYSTL